MSSRVVRLPRSLQRTPTGVLLTLFLRVSPEDRQRWLLPVAAYAAASGMLTCVLAGVSMVWRTGGELAADYRVFALSGLILLTVPLTTLAASAARLSAQRNDERLSTLRLLGASGRSLRVLVLTEAAGHALVGVVLGVLGYVIVLPLLALLPFGGGPVGLGAMWLGLPGLLAAAGALVALAAVSAAVGLRKVSITPLAVRTRQNAAVTRRARLIAAIGVIAGAVVVSRLLPGGSDTVFATAMVLLLMGVPMLALNLAGPWLVQFGGRRALDRAATPVRLVAARSVLESPKAAWRQVAAVAMLTFMSVFVSLAVALMSNGEAVTHAQRVALQDVRLGTALTLLVGFVTVSLSLVVHQYSAIMDRRELLVRLDLAGMPREQINAVRREAVTLPLVAVLAGSFLAAVVVLIPLAGAAALAQPVSLIFTALVIAAGLGCVLAALRVTRGAVERALDEPFGVV